jgi:ribosomal protein S14
MKTELIKLIKNKLKKKKFLKNEIKYKILKSIFQNKKINPNKRLFSFFLILKSNNKINKLKNICLLTSKTNGLIKDFGISRNMMKYLLNHNKAQNIKANSW